jgi:4a-hydroxytetrahydrobiopterin dehydratase
MNDLTKRRCIPCEGGVKALSREQTTAKMSRLHPRWKLENDAISATFEFRDYAATLAFVNAVAFIAVREDHHPDITFGYKTCAVHYSTHAVGGLSDNDFLCAEMVDALLG